jgi:hypothetical protein
MANPKKDAIDVTLRPAKTARNIAPYLHRADVLVQRWRWQGRPLFWEDGQHVRTDFPFKAIESDSALLARLDGMLFGDRRADDYLMTGARTEFGTDSSLLKDGISVYTHDTSTTPQALYYRFAIRVFSRYEGWLKRRASLDSRFRQQMPKQDVPAELWQRLVVKCRQATPPAPPTVKLIVPLTQTRDAKVDETPGWLVVLEEPWQQYAGLAEAFEASVERVRNFSKNDKGEINPPEFVEVGPDPLESLKAPAVLATGAPDVKILPVGPIGFTFDTDTEAPLMVRAAFFLPAPEIASIKPHELGNYFFKLAFRRTVVAGGMMPGLPASVASRFTEPQETQLLPSSSFWDTDQGQRVHVSQLRYDGKRKQFFLESKPEQPITIVGSSTNHSSLNALDIRLLLKDPVTDAFGRTDQETVVGNTLYEIGKPEAPVATYAHIVEVQRPTAVTAAAGPQSLPGDLFPGTPEDNSADVRRRIVRVSPRIEPL